jgi:hypothetical protein
VVGLAMRSEEMKRSFQLHLHSIESAIASSPTQPTDLRG